MTKQEIIEAINSLKPLFCNEFKSVMNEWEDGDFVSIGYLYHKWNGTTPEENRIRVEKLVYFLEQTDLDLLT